MPRYQPNSSLDSSLSHSTTVPAASGAPSRTRFLVELFIAFLVTRLPVISVPFKWLESYFHELSHGLATIISGGAVSHIELFPNGAGLCFSQGGWPLLIGFAGYFGAALWGYLIFMFATWPRGIRVSFAILGGAVVLTTLLWARDLLTISILVTLAVLFLLPLKLKQNRFLASGLRVIALMIILNALASPVVLLGLDGQGDANMLAQQSWLPAWFWVAIWLATSALMLYLCWRRVDGAAERRSNKIKM
ncbi:M50 family metallopeptidase [Shewanella schlegeliana]|uniref:M50 family metallopeptidase n=1 Tax=Shewanella schlegeliana TaxID=190308 RepID=A0ABS1SU57_9GAMM|nr:M50 family metallopeptidase [Shewanella schlegeliana]MBL4911934.1 M50 family metallopeptidase [Shewanella schlegeliana]MCL1110113.1 M50 family metallopeptidase [Shewanella schlegeliana]GIU26806.1 membrane zinc metalloprotease [Shewanella schlegeliana]